MHRSKLSLFSAITVTYSLSAAVGCMPAGNVPIGEHEKDSVALADSANLKHVGDALSNGSNIGALFTGASELAFDGAPNPTALLEQTSAMDNDRDVEGATELSVVSFNLALLDAKLLFGTVPYAQSPYIEERAERLPDIVFSAGYDVIMLQELWRDDHAATFAEVAASYGYHAEVSRREGHNDGLGIFIKDSILEDGAVTEYEEAPYAAQDGTGIVPGFDDVEWFPGPGIKRGWQMVGFNHPDVGHIQVFNTHMQAFPASWLGRMLQARELGIIITEKASEGTITFVGGDHNAGPYYRDDVWTVPDGSAEDGWWANSLSYPILLEYGELTDMVVMGRSAAHAADDVTFGDTVVNNFELALDVPGSAEGWCEATPDVVFTANDCNPLYFMQYAGTEYPARLDHLHVRDPDGRVFVQRSGLTFTAKRSFGDELYLPPSDHYGVFVNLHIAP